MYKHMLIAVDGSEVGQKALEQGLELAKAIGSQVTVVKVTEMWSALSLGSSPQGSLEMIRKFESHNAELAKTVLDKAKEEASSRGVACATLHVPDRVPADGILQAAKDKGCDVIVMGSHGRRGFQRMLLGSQANEVLARSPVTVIVCR